MSLEGYYLLNMIKPKYFQTSFPYNKYSENKLIDTQNVIEILVKKLEKLKDPDRKTKTRSDNSNNMSNNSNNRTKSDNKTSNMSNNSDHRTSSDHKTNNSDNKTNPDNKTNNFIPSEKMKKSKSKKGGAIFIYG